MPKSRSVQEITSEEVYAAQRIFRRPDLFLFRPPEVSFIGGQ